MNVRGKRELDDGQTSKYGPPPHQRQNATQLFARPRGDNHNFCPWLKCLQVRERPFRTVENFSIVRFVAQASPVDSDLLNQFPSAALHAHGKLLSRNYLPALCRHYFCLF